MGDNASIPLKISHLDRAAARIAAGQHGNVTRQQLLAIGMSDTAIRGRLQLGRLHRVYPGVYAVGRPPRTALERASAAVLACGPGAVLSHYSALALWGLTAKWPSRFEVTVPGDRRPKGVRVHRAQLARRDLRSRNGIRVTSPARTLLDCAPRLTDKALTRAYNDARRTLGVRPHHVLDVLERYASRPGGRRLEALVDVRGGPTRSGWEDEFPAFCRRFGLPEPLMCARVAGYEVDALFVEEKLIVELDGWDFHSDRVSFESDRERDAATLAEGHPTVRITWQRIHHRAAAEAARLHEILRQRRRGAA